MKSGKLSALGIALSNGDKEKLSDQLFEILESEYEHQSDLFSKIPQNEWVRNGINWDGSSLKHGNNFYAWVQFSISDVFDAFPPKKTNPTTAFRHGRHVHIEDYSNNLTRAKKKSGRPTKDWTAVNVKIAQLIVEYGGLPQKQDALAYELVEWYKKTFGDNIGISTVKAKLKPYYEADTFKKSRK